MTFQRKQTISRTKETILYDWNERILKFARSLITEMKISSWRQFPKNATSKKINIRNIQICFSRSFVEPIVVQYETIVLKRDSETCASFKHIAEFFLILDHYLLSHLPDIFPISILVYTYRYHYCTFAFVSSFLFYYYTYCILLHLYILTLRLETELLPLWTFIFSVPHFS